ncbi:NfeD family protein [Paenibacillus mendelii]|uniref:NfeD family protein n=1 Tax=Paenibacillus mendelii TaxID=206163 RepID=A0ABV6J555_9BACL|nr:NfeD family protein [Paenibacillus mendelii]MCQ6560383.1 protease [Paenibacillus mendelii]
MEALFWSCMVGGILFAVVSVIFGDWLSLALDGMLDFLSLDGHHWLQPMSVVGGITVFGGAGLLLYRYSPLGDAVIILLSILIAVTAAVLVYFLYVRPMERSENSTGYSMKELTGAIAEVLVPVPVGGYGEVMIKVGAGRTNHIAASYEGDSIPTGTRVVVVDVKEGALMVSKLDL